MLYIHSLFIRFNPCFGGFSFRTRNHQTNGSRRMVSILVLVDFLFGLWLDRDITAEGNGFNPCFGGFSFRTSVS